MTCRQFKNRMKRDQPPPALGFFRGGLDLLRGDSQREKARVPGSLMFETIAAAARLPEIAPADGCAVCWRRGTDLTPLFESCANIASQGKPAGHFTVTTLRDVIAARIGRVIWVMPQKVSDARSPLILFDVKACNNHRIYPAAGLTICAGVIFHIMSEDVNADGHG